MCGILDFKHVRHNLYHGATARPHVSDKDVTYLLLTL